MGLFERNFIGRMKIMSLAWPRQPNNQWWKVHYVLLPCNGRRSLGSV